MNMYDLENKDTRVSPFLDLALYAGLCPFEVLIGKSSLHLLDHSKDFLEIKYNVCEFILI